MNSFTRNEKLAQIIISIGPFTFELFSRNSLLEGFAERGVVEMV